MADYWNTGSTYDPAYTQQQQQQYQTQQYPTQQYPTAYNPYSSTSSSSAPNYWGSTSGYQAPSTSYPSPTSSYPTAYNPYSSTSSSPTAYNPYQTQQQQQYQTQQQPLPQPAPSPQSPTNWGFMSAMPSTTNVAMGPMRNAGPMDTWQEFRRALPRDLRDEALAFQKSRQDAARYNRNVRQGALGAIQAQAANIPAALQAQLPNMTMAQIQQLQANGILPQTPNYGATMQAMPSWKDFIASLPKEQRALARDFRNERRSSIKAHRDALNNPFTGMSAARNDAERQRVSDMMEKMYTASYTGGAGGM